MSADFLDKFRARFWDLTDVAEAVRAKAAPVRAKFDRLSQESAAALKPLRDGRERWYHGPPLPTLRCCVACGGTSYNIVQPSPGTRPCMCPQPRTWQRTCGWPRLA